MKRLFALPPLLFLLLAIPIFLYGPMFLIMGYVALLYVAVLYAITYGGLRLGQGLNANTITNLIPTLYEALDIVSREMIGLIPAVSRNSGLERVALNQVVNIPIVPAIVGGNVTPGATPPADGDQVMGNTTMTISKSRYWPVRWTGEELLSTSNSGLNANIARDQFAQAFRAATGEIEADLAALYIGFSRAYGTAGTPPFGTATDMTDFSGPLRILDDNGAPVGDRQMVLGSAAINNIRGKQTILLKANEAGSSDLLRRGILGQVLGLDIHNSAGIKTVVKGTGAAYTSDGAGYAIGAKVITLITGAGTVVAGDNVTFAGDTNIYVVTTGVGAPGAITLGENGLRVAIPAAATAMTIGTGGTRNMVFARSAIQLATRMPALPIIGGVAKDMAEDRVQVIDPMSGLAFDVSMYLQYKQVKYEVAIAWGQKLVKPEHTAILLG